MTNMVDPSRSVDESATEGRPENKSLENKPSENKPQTAQRNGRQSGRQSERRNQESHNLSTDVLLNEEYTIDTPENVTFGYEVAGIGSRFIGVLVDTLIVIIAWMLLSIASFLALVLATGVNNAINIGGSGSEQGWIGGIIAGGYIILNFILFWGYFIVFEYIWNGQTPGKRVAKIRVLGLDGNPLTIMQNLVRNLVRIADFFPFAYAVGLVTMFFNRHARRLGDFAAGTIVVKDHGELSLSDLHGDSHSVSRANFADGESQSSATLSPVLSSTLTAPSRANDPLLQQFPQIHRLSTADYELITDCLVRHKQEKFALLQINRLATIIASKIKAEPPSCIGGSHFLQKVAEAYRRAGR